MCDIHDSLIAFIDSISCESTPAMVVTLGTSHEHDATEKGNIVQQLHVYIYFNTWCVKDLSLPYAWQFLWGIYFLVSVHKSREILEK